MAKRYFQELTKWTKIAKRLMIWDYTGNFKDELGIYPNILSLQGNVQLYKNAGTMVMFSQGPNIHSEFSELKTYVVAKLLWNVNLNFTVLCNEFIEAYYGKAADIVKKYLKETHAVVLAEGRNLYNQQIMIDFDWFDCNLTTWLEFWRKTEELVKGDKLMEYYLTKSGASILYHRYFRIHKERYGMQFHWTAGSDFVRPVWVPKETGDLAKELALRIRSPNKIVLSEPPLRARYDNVEIDLCNNGYNVSKKSSSEFTAGITQDLTKKLIYLLVITL